MGCKRESAVADEPVFRNTGDGPRAVKHQPPSFISEKNLKEIQTVSAYRTLPGHHHTHTPCLLTSQLAGICMLCLLHAAVR